MKYTIIVKDTAIYNVIDTYEVEANSKEEAVEQVENDCATLIDSFSDFIEYNGILEYIVHERV